MQDLNDLHYFAQVVRHGGFSATSRATGEPKSKLSKRVAQLEQDLGVRLIERSTRSLQLTEIGRHVLAQCEVIASGVEATEAIVARSRDEVRGSLRMTCAPQLPHLLGPGPMTTFLIRYPPVRVQLHLSNRRVDLINERYDIALYPVQLGDRPVIDPRNLGSSHPSVLSNHRSWLERIIRTRLRRVAHRRVAFPLPRKQSALRYRETFAVSFLRVRLPSMATDPLHDGRSDHQRDQPRCRHLDDRRLVII
jgi:DNA-binding transcriptional LysR family regulator